MEAGRIPRQEPSPEPTPPPLGTVETVPSGWLAFAGLLLIVVGCFNLISGFASLFRPDYLVRIGGSLFLLNYTSWGWILIGFGGAQLLAGIGATSGSMWARGLGILLAVLNAVAHLVFMSVFPFWSLTVIAFDVLIIYGLTTPMTLATRW